MKPFLLILTLLVTSFCLQAQLDPYDQMKADFDSLRNEDNYEEALATAKQMNAWALENESDTSLRFANSNYALGRVFYFLQDYHSSISYLENALDLQQKLNYNLDFKAKVNYQLGESYFKTDDLRMANSNFTEALEAYYIIYGEKNIQLANCLTYLSICYRLMGDIYKSTVYIFKAVDIHKEICGKESIEYAKDLYEIGLLYSLKNEFEAALSYTEEALYIYDKYSARNISNYNLQISFCCSLLGRVYQYRGEYKSAESFFNKALEFKKQIHGENNPELIVDLNALGLLYINMKDYAKAKIYLEYALHIEKNFLSENSSIELKGNLALVYLFTTDFNALKPILYDLYDYEIQTLKYGLKWRSADERLGFLNIEDRKINNLYYTSIKSYSQLPSSTTKLFDLGLITKSLLMQSNMDFKKIIKETGDTNLLFLNNQKQNLKKVYSKMISEGSTNRELLNQIFYEIESREKFILNTLFEFNESRFKMLKIKDEIKNTNDSISKEFLFGLDSTLSYLNSILKEYDSFDRKFEITWRDVQSNLNPKEAAIEFTEYYDFEDSVSKYMALVVRPEYEYPKMALLGDEEQISEYIENRAFEALYPIVWEPIDKHLDGVERVYYSPAGQLNNLSFSALCMGERTELSQTDSSKTRNIIILGSNSDYECSYLMDRYELHQLTTTRYIADGTLKKEASMNTSIALSGGINYDLVPKAHSVNKEQDNTEYLFDLNLQKEKERENTNRSSENTSKMAYLEGTKKEVDQITALFQNTNWSLSAYTDTKAEEGKFKEEVEQNKAGIIHIATHGFAFPDVKKNERQQLMGTEEISYRASEDPMVRCGLMFSGSNVSWTGNSQKMIKETGEDGILTAAEVSNMDLSNTKLVVLSACETGLGKIEGSEGTFGLKRGFKLAGVEQMIVSLWSVPDKETMELMTLFYEDLTQSLNPVKSFEKAQKQMRDTYPTRPDLWASFVLVR